MKKKIKFLDIYRIIEENHTSRLVSKKYLMSKITATCLIK